ncbi:right-handed parallel beta-helix repeat-containing protein [Methanolapillus millepedarum]|uniref:Right-handed parallel beta-helix repeat-containing protein n=1 Tax=Methanolapillus millepedarum TaxID=3028296 RepID=A0AA96V3A5_9EURY|nr:hypothetical protein MsAc7_08680 [Methanosarcinaceae archaeon Ac7]
MNYSKMTKIMMFSLLALLLLVGVASAQEWVVTSSGDTVNNTNITDQNNLTLRQAVEKSVSGDTITFANDVSAVNMVYGELKINKDLTISGNANKVIIGRSNSSATQEMGVFNISGGNVVFRNINIENGSTTTGNGGGLLVTGNANVTLDSCSLQRNRAANGGAIYLDGGTVTMTSTTVYRNSAITDGGAFVIKNGTITMNGGYVDTHTSKNNTIQLMKGRFDASNVNFANNSVSDIGTTVNGSAATSMTFKYCTFTNNTGLSSGSIYTVSSLVAENCIFDNVKSNTSGGAISLGTGADATVRYSIFSNNKANDDGGAIHIGSGSNATLDTCTFNNNSAGYGGAIFNVGNATITACTATNNTAKLYGGAVASWNDGSTTMNKTVLTNNTANGNGTNQSAGGGLNVSRGHASIGNNVIVGNKDPRSVDFGEENATVQSLGNNLVGIYKGSGKFPVSSTDAAGITADAVFDTSSGYPSLSKDTGYRAGTNQSIVYTVALNSSSSNPAISVLGSNTSPQPSNETNQSNQSNPSNESNQSNATNPEPSGNGNMSWIWYVLIAIVVIAVLGIVVYALIKYNNKRQYKF